MGSLFDTLKKEFGDGVIATLANRPPIEAISTGSQAINYIVGPYCPGVPLGKLSQIYGGEGSGKSLLCCQIISEAQRIGIPAYLVDRENHYTKEWFERFGGDSSKVVDLHPETIEQCFQMLVTVCDYMKEAKEYGGVFVIDSLQSLPTQKQYDSDPGSGEGLAASARYLSSKLSGYVNRMREVGLALIVVGQIRDNPNPYARADEREYTPGGNALAHYSVLRLKMTQSGVILEKLDDQEYRIGFKSKVETVKNDVGGMAPRKLIELEFFDGSGADDTSAMFLIAQQLGLVKRRGAWYYVGESKFQGQPAWKIFIKENPEIYKDIRDRMFDPSIVLRGEAERITSREEQETE